MFVEIVAFLLKMFASHYCVDFFHIFSMIIQSYIKACFYFSYILFITENTLHQIHDVAAGTVDVLEYLIHFLVCLLLKVVVFLTRLQQSDLKFVRHGEHLPCFCLCICLFLTLFFSISLLPINSSRFFISPKCC